MNVINYITITCNLKNVRLRITFDYMKNVIDYNRLRLQITITPCLVHYTSIVVSGNGIYHYLVNISGKYLPLALNE